MKNDFQYGIKRGLVIAAGYLFVSFTFGIMAVSGGIPAWMTVFISMSNLTSAGQFSGTKLIIAGAGYLEIMLTTFIINIRYMLMSLSLTQRLDKRVTFKQRLVIAFGITDETFSLASMEQGSLTYPYLLGLITGPFLGWSIGTAMGALICSALPQALGNAMKIALYGMFIAIIIPPAKKLKPVRIIILISVAIVCILRYTPFLRIISSGFRTIIATLIAAGIGAFLFPIKSEAAKETDSQEQID